MWSSFRQLTTNLLRQPQQFTLPKRTTFILRRCKVPRLNKLGDFFPKKFKRREYYYELVEEIDYKNRPPLEIVLTADVSGIGMKGEKIQMDKFDAYKDLLLPKLAVYASAPEAMELLQTAQEKQYSSKYSKIVENYLAAKPLEIIVSYDSPWTLKPWHIKLALRKVGVSANEDCITIPKEISGPNHEIENKDFLVYLTMNKSEKFALRCRIYHWSALEPLLNHKTIDLNSPSEPLFADEKEKIESILSGEREIRRNKMIRGEDSNLLKDKKKKKKRR